MARPGYSELPSDVKDVEVAATVRNGLRLLLSRVRDNRLARITELTGLDIASPRGNALALAALLLRGNAAW
ncbi:hypothetical protein ACIOEW_33125 [Streptomyces sp. NPDC087901]|uniref:hypothetical protein n=1 Tax=Streptomyces sp. NPDC087901 TaxID=3365818 RepID=UPI003812AD9A